MTRILLVVLAIALAGCPASPPPPTTTTGAPTPVEPTPVEPAPVEPTPTTPDPTAGSTPKGDGASCLDAAECASGICEGEGCSAQTPGTCAPKARGCTRDLRPYCGCDGQTFRTSGTCPGKRFSARSACP